MFDPSDLLAWVRSLLHLTPAPIPRYDAPTGLWSQPW